MFDKFIDKLQNDKFLTLETTPKHSPVFQPVLDRIEELGLHNKVDGFTTTDNPLAKLKYSSYFASLKLQQRFNKPAIATVTMRDSNKIGLQSNLLGANDVDVRAILALTGDPVSYGDQPKAKGVFEGKSTLMMDIIRCFNSGIDYSGKPLEVKPKNIYTFAVINAHAKNPKNLLKKMKEKLIHGAIGIITQPVYSVENAKMLLELFDQAKEEVGEKCQNSQLILGFFPITKLRTAQFLTSHVPGVNVPSNWMDKFIKAKKVSDEEQRKIGLELSMNSSKEIYKLHPKMHIMTANNFSLAKEIIEGL